ncbi:LIC12162 family transferase [Leptospira kmetyi]|uniref:LIC12162 family transferase n=1 Tax=Leptospira kmetyi TaxID=408139 RepID=UPI003EB70A39
MKRYLVTTADERTWKKDVPILFLGEWCRRYDRKHVWSALDYEVALPYGVDPNVKKNDFDYLESLRLVFLNEITEALNQLHSVSYSTRYWNLVLGHWILRYLRVFYNRYKTMEQVLDRYEISGTTELKFDDYDLAPNDSIGFILDVGKNFWNHNVNIEILKFFNFSAFEESSESAKELNAIAHPIVKPFWKKVIVYFLNRVLPVFARNSDAFLVNTYLPIQKEILLQLSLRQIPQFWRLQELPEWTVDKTLRSSVRIEEDGKQDFETYARRNILKVLPRCFVEGFEELLQTSKEINWPKKPRFIFTSNNFDTDELFKVWAAEKTIHGVPYVIGQHGNNYGTLRGIQKSPELVSADRFITWGWSADRKHIPAFVFTKCGEKEKNHDPQGGLLLIEFPPAIRLGPEDCWFDFTKYFEEQLYFYKSLPDRIREKTIVRLHNSSKNSDWFDENRWRDFDPNVHIDSSHLKLNELISKSRVVVHSYDSTGILETLSLNIPTLCFWRNEFTHVVEEALPYYEKLREAGIFYSSMSDLTDFLSKRWETIDTWWYSEIVQAARVVFCNQYARRVKMPVSILRHILLNSTNHQFSDP